MHYPRNAYNQLNMRSWAVRVLRLSLYMALLAGSAISQSTPTTTVGTQAVSSRASTQASQLKPAQALIKAGKFKDAAELLRRTITQQPAPEAYAGLVTSLLKLDDVSGADEASSMGLRAYPQSANTVTARADVRFRNGAITEAQALYQSALQVDGKSARAWLGMGRVESALSHASKAKEAFARAHELDPDDGDALYYWSVRQPYPENVNGLEKHMAEFHDDAERERHEREYIAFLKALAGRKVWTLAREVDQSDIHLQPVITRLQDGPRAYALSVRLNDRTAANVMLDTGASGLTISRKLAEKAGVRKLSEHSLEGVGSAGAAMGYEAWLDKVVIGDFEFHDCHVHVSPNMNADYDGLMGTDIFEQYFVTVDFPERRLHLSKPKNLQRTQIQGSDHSDPLQFFRVGHILLMPTSVGDTAQGLFALDTGSSTNTISPALARQVSIVRDSNVPVNGMSGRVKNVYSADRTTLQFGRFQQPHENIVTFDVHELSKDLGVEVSGFIGFATLKKMKLMIDYQNGLVDFEYKP
jgi:tetratricopeptide (TPR) repeat protein